MNDDRSINITTVKPTGTFTTTEAVNVVFEVLNTLSPYEQNCVLGAVRILLGLNEKS